MPHVIVKRYPGKSEAQKIRDIILLACPETGESVLKQCGSWVHTLSDRM